MHRGVDSEAFQQRNLRTSDMYGHLFGLEMRLNRIC